MKYKIIIDDTIFEVETRIQAFSIYNHYGYEVNKIILKRDSANDFWKKVVLHCKSPNSEDS